MDPAWQGRVDSADIDAGSRGDQPPGVPFPDADIFERASVVGPVGQHAMVDDRAHPERAWRPVRRVLTSSVSHRLRSRRSKSNSYPGFSSAEAGSTGLKRGLLRLHETAVLLERYAADHGGAEEYFREALAESGGEPEDLAVAIGSSPRWKLPGFGIALAAEALRHIGFDVSKPDRHVLRCMGAWELVTFRKWSERSDFTAPDASPSELHQTMCAVKALARANGLGTSYVNAVIWTAGALSGARLTNSELRAIKAGCSPGRPAPNPTIAASSDYK